MGDVAAPVAQPPWVPASLQPWKHHDSTCVSLLRSRQRWRLGLPEGLNSVPCSGPSHDSPPEAPLLKSWSCLCSAKISFVERGSRESCSVYPVKNFSLWEIYVGFTLQLGLSLRAHGQRLVGLWSALEVTWSSLVSSARGSLGCSPHWVVRVSQGLQQHS